MNDSAYSVEGDSSLISKEPGMKEEEPIEDDEEGDNSEGELLDEEVSGQSNNDQIKSSAEEIEVELQTKETAVE